MPPDGRLRLSQLTSTFGPGALLDLVDDAVLVGGLDFWRPSEGGGPIHEPRLQAAVAEVMSHYKRPLSAHQPFRRPPAGDEDIPNEGVGVQVYEFPRWFLCQNPECKALVRSSQLERRNRRYVHGCGGPDRREERCVPIRFVVACRRGHLDDVDWPRWVHENAHNGPCEQPRLRFDEDSSGDFGDIRVVCTTCGHYRYLIDFEAKEKAPFCSGARPWLGPEGREPCTERTRLLIRTASNTYFPQAMSALSIPERPSVRQAVQRVWNILQSATRETLPVFRTIVDVQKSLGDASDADVWAAIEDIRANRPEATPELRTAEYLQLTTQPPENHGEMPPDDPDEIFWARTARGRPYGDHVRRVVLARRLREVVAQIGFTRLEPASVDLQGRYDLGVELAPLSLQRDWLPATEILGEGIFIELDEDAVRRWEQRPEVIARVSQLESAFDAWRKAHGSKMAFPGGRFYLLHSLSHLLINALSLECGYPASAIRERIYCAPASAAVPMAGILLSTGTSGVEGTLGGLVEEGHRIGLHLRRAIQDARLCSYDPVCAQHRPDDASERFLEGAACHGCLFVAECSCERFNQFLDRALVAPALGHAGVAFFGPEDG